MKKVIYLTAIAIVLNACGSVGNTFLSDEALQEKAAQALRTSAHNVVISERNPGIDDIKFNATVHGKKHYCYVTTTAVKTSHAVCSEMKPSIKVKTS